MTSALVGLRSTARSLLVSRARDVTHSIAPRSALVVAPHPDDETIGCGARILLSRQAGARVSLVVLTDGGGSHSVEEIDTAELVAMRSAELAEAARRLDVPAEDVHELGYPDGGLAACLPAVRADLLRLIAEVKPDDVYVTCAAEFHPDHAAASAAVRAVLAELEQPPRLLEYPIWLWTDWPVSRRLRNGSGLWQWLGVFTSRRLELITVDGVRSDKRAVLAAYTSQIGGPRRIEDRDRGAASATGAPSMTGGLGAELIGRAIAGPELFFQPRVTPRDWQRYSWMVRLRARRQVDRGRPRPQTGPKGPDGDAYPSPSAASEM